MESPKLVMDYYLDDHPTDSCHTDATVARYRARSLRSRSLAQYRVSCFQSLVLSDQFARCADTNY